MDYIPHAGEIGLIVAVVLIIFGLGRLPQLSYKLAGGELPDRDATPPGDSPPAEDQPQPEEGQEAEVLVNAEPKLKGSEGEDVPPV